MDKYADLSAEALASLATEKRTAFDALVALEAPTIEQVDEAEALANEIDEINAEINTREEAASAAAEKFASLRSRFSQTPDEEETDEDAEVEDENLNGVDDADEGDPAEDAAPDQEQSAPTQARSKGVVRLASKTKRPVAPKRAGNGPITITAAANVDGFSTGQSLPDLLDVSKAVIAKAKGFAPPTGDGQSESLQKFGTALFSLDFPEDLVIDRHDDAMEVLARAADESRLEGGSLTAAGGWCAPSETVYDLTQDATTEGMVSLPEVAVRRGGIRFAQSPNFADFYANPGFIQTEAQAIAGTTKPCIEVDCPDFTEVRLDAEGICIKVPILTNAGYPEYVKNFVEGSLVAHQHWINANVINRMVTVAGAARVITGLGSTALDLLGGLELIADQRRQAYRLSMSRTLEVVLPFWVRGAIRADLSARNGVALAAITDAEIARHFASRNLNVQFVYDWQPLPEADVADDPGTTGVNEAVDAEVYPDTFNVLMYPAGTFVKGTADVINLSTVYDAASLAENVYTGMFTEQGLLVAHMKFRPDLLTIPVCNAGRTGAANLTCA